MKALYYFLFTAITWVFGGSYAEYASSLDSCGSFQAFEIMPEDAKFIIGGPFPFYAEDCSRVKIDVVQELIAMQWALNFWNQDEKHFKYKLSLSALGTCSRDDEELSRMLQFLRDYKFFTAKECRRNSTDTSSIPLGLILSKSVKTTAPMKSILQSLNIPIVTQSPLTHFILKDLKPGNIFLTTASLTQYTEMAIRIMKETQNNLATVVYNSDHLPKDHLQSLITFLNDANIKIFDEIPLSKILDPKIDFFNDTSAYNVSSIILAFLDKADLVRLVDTAGRNKNVRQLFVSIPLQDETFSDSETTRLAEKSGKSQILLIKTANSFIPEFKHYFLDVIKNNYQSYPFMSHYLQQQYNCTLINVGHENGMLKHCTEMTYANLADTFSQVTTIESAALSIYTFAAMVTTMVENGWTENFGKKPMAKFSYTFTQTDPPFLRKLSNITFDDSGAIKHIELAAYHVTRSKDGVVQSRLVAEQVPKNNKPMVHVNQFKWTDDESRVTSICSYNLPQCLVCNRIERVDGKVISLENSANLYLMGLFDMRTWNRELAECAPASDPGAIVAPLAFFYILETIKQKYSELKLLNHVDVGRLMSDGCQSKMNTVRVISTAASDCLVVNARLDNKNVTISSQNIVGLVSSQNDNVYAVTRYLLSSNDSPPRLLLGATPSSSSTFSNYNELNVMPDYELYGKAIVEFLSKNLWTYVTVLLSAYDPDSTQAYDIFRPLAEAAQICIGEVLRVTRNQQTFHSLNLSTKVVLIFGTANDAAMFMKSQRPTLKDKPVFYILINGAHDFETVFQANDSSSWNQAALGSISIQPSLYPDPNFVSFLETVGPKLLPEKWFVSFWEEYFQCTVILNPSFDHPQQQHSFPVHKNKCTNSEKLPVEKFGRLTKVAYLMNGLETLMFILDGIYKKLCPEQNGLCDGFFEQYRELMFELVEKVPKVAKFTIYNYKYDSEELRGRFFQVGNWTVQNGLTYSESMVWYPSADRVPNTTLPESTCTLPACRCNLPADFFTKPIVDDDAVEDIAGSVELLKKTHELQQTWRFVPSTQEDPLSMPVRRDVWKTQTWTYVFLVITTILLMCAVAILGLVIVKLFYRVIKGNQSLGICLIFGVIALFVTSYFFIFDPDAITCRLRYFGHSLSYCICFGVMIAKACQLRNSETVGLNGYVSFWNYWLLLFFIVAVQLALNLQWIIGRSPIVMNVVQQEQMLYVRCNWDHGEFLVSHVYVIILLAMATFLAFVSRNVKRNYKETRWLLYACLLCSPIWLIWTTCYALAPPKFQDTIVVMELISCAAVILCFMFGPKVYILLSYEPVLVEYQPSCKFHQNPFTSSKVASFDDSAIYFDPDNFAAMPVCRKSSISCVGGVPKSPTEGKGNSASSTISDDGSIYQTAIRKKKNSKKGSRKDQNSKMDEVSTPPESPETTVTRENPIYDDPVMKNDTASIS